MLAWLAILLFGMTSNRWSAVRSKRCNRDRCSRQARFQAGRGRHLHAVAEFERTVKDQRNPRDQVAEGALRGQTDHHRGDTHAGQHGFAQCIAAAE
jgi:hypothetical protein